MEQSLNVNNIVNDAAENARVFMDGFVNEKQLMQMLIAMIVVGLLLCLFGLKLVKVMATITGFVIGAAAGLVVCSVAELTGTTAAIVVFACALIVALLSFFLYRVGVFFWIFNMSMGASFMFIDPEVLIQIVIALAVSIILAVLSVIYIEPIVIITTALVGGVEAGTAVAQLMNLESNPWIGYGIGFAIAVVGMIVQFMMQSRKVGKKEKIYSAKMKQSASVESEVEKARMILDDEIEAEADDEKDMVIIEDFGDSEDN